MAQIKINYRNILESSTVTTTTANASFPAYRLYDRDIGKLFKGTAFASPFVIKAVQAAAPIYDVDRLIIPVGHNLNGLACSLRYSTDDFSADDHEAVGWTQGNALLIDKSFTLANKRYWKLNVTAPATIVEMPEFFLGSTLSFTQNPTFGSVVGKKRNFLRDETQSGRVRSIKLGEVRREIVWDLNVIASAQKTDFESWLEGIVAGQFFYVTDEAGNVFFAELLNDLEFIYKANGIYSCTLNLLEVL